MNLDTLNFSLEKHFDTIDKIILSRQDPITGLLPASIAVNAHGDYTDAWVRDNVYSILCVWGLAISYRKHAPDHQRSYVLGQSVVKLMRGMLAAMMRQSDKVEAFKHTLDPIDALHAKYGTKTGLAVVGDDEWGHLQLDASSLFLLMIAQMTASGLRLIYTIDEVNFIQNMVHYVSRTYCTPDYGIWERGHKINRGTPEINCSSVGMAKAALEAMDGFNLFGNVASQEAIIHVVPSDVARTRFTLHSLLPRESISKETDAALLSVIGYPAYAIEDDELVQRTRDKIIKKLAGNYGCKRFLLDGHQSSIEDESRLYYEPSELRQFEHVESEWPLFFTYLLLDALMREDSEAVEHWKKKLEPLFVEEDGHQLIPELYIVPEELIEAEKQKPGSQTRVPNENLPLVWAQSLYILSDMILDGVLRPSDIDPLRRREQIGHLCQNHPLVPVLAENDAVKQRLHDFGFFSETLEELKPIRIMQASQLSEVHTTVGKNDKLLLTGRPLLVSRTITTSRLHVLAGEEIVFLPYYFNPHGFYFSYDNKLLVEQFRSSLQFLAKHWDQPGQPIMPFLVREDMLQDIGQGTMNELLHDFQRGVCDSLVVKSGPLGQSLTTAAVERIDNIHGFEFKDPELKLSNKYFCTSDTGSDINDPLTVEELQTLENGNDMSLVHTLTQNSNRRMQTGALSVLWQRHGAGFEVMIGEKSISLSSIAEQYYETATLYHDWAIVRRIADITDRYDDRLEDVLLDIVIRQKHLAVGRAYYEEATFSKPMESAAIVGIIKEFSGSNVAENVLTQEVILHLGHLIQTKSELFENMPTLRTWYFIKLLAGQISREKHLSISDAYELLLGMAPHDIYDHLRTILNSFAKEETQLNDHENLHASGVSSLDSIKTTPMNVEESEVNDWMQWRQEAGMIGRLPRKFHKTVWYMLQQCTGIVIGDRYNIQNRMGAEHTLESTAGERNFELMIDRMLQNIPAPEYRQLYIEVIESTAWLFKQNPSFRVDNDLILDVLIGHAVRINWEKQHSVENYDQHRGEAWEVFYKLSPHDAGEVFVEAFMYLLTAGGFSD